MYAGISLACTINSARSLSIVALLQVVCTPIARAGATSTTMVNTTHTRKELTAVISTAKPRCRRDAAQSAAAVASVSCASERALLVCAVCVV